jgi:hypothetical protein
MPRRDPPRAPRKGEVTKTLLDLLADVYSEMDSLREELQEWLDNMPENLQNGSKADELREAIDQIEGVQEIECPKSLEKINVTWVARTKMRKSRAERRDDCLAALDAAIQILIERDKADEESLQSELQDAHDEYEAVDFPGMH